MRSIAAVLTALTVWLLAGHALAAADGRPWLRAESANFVFYSSGDENRLRETVRRFEMFDAALRQIVGVSPAAPPVRRLPVYLVEDGATLRQARPDASRDATYYLATGSHMYLLAVETRLQAHLPYLSYARYFLDQHRTGAYPAWYLEGLLAYLSAVDIEGDEITIGLGSRWRGAQLTEGPGWLPFSVVVSQRANDLPGGDDRLAMYLAQAWVLTHWFHSDPARALQLQAYLSAVAAGEDPILSLETATGMSMAQLDRTIVAYAHDSLTAQRFQVSTRPPVAVWGLSAAHDDLLAPSLSLTYGLDGEEAAEAIADIRRGVARHPADPFARLISAIGEYRFGDRASGVQQLETLVAQDPQNLEALFYLATARYEAALDLDGPDRIRLLSQSSRLLAQALAIDPNDYRLYAALGRNRQLSPDYPNENDIQTWAIAYRLAPQVQGSALGFARALMLADRHAEAVGVLTPIVENIRSRPPANAEVTALLAAAREAQPPPPHQPLRPWRGG